MKAPPKFLVGIISGLGRIGAIACFIASFFVPRIFPNAFGMDRLTDTILHLIGAVFILIGIVFYLGSEMISLHGLFDRILKIVETLVDLPPPPKTAVLDRQVQDLKNEVKSAVAAQDRNFIAVVAIVTLGIAIIGCLVAIK